MISSINSILQYVSLREVIVTYPCPASIIHADDLCLYTERQLQFLIRNHFHQWFHAMPQLAEVSSDPIQVEGVQPRFGMFLAFWDGHEPT